MRNILRIRAEGFPGPCCRSTADFSISPTTALDVTTQTQILDLMRQLQHEDGMAIMLITHDLGVVAEMATDVAVMYLGRVVEQAPVDEIFHAPVDEIWGRRDLPCAAAPVYAGAPALHTPHALALARAAHPHRGGGAASLRPALRLPLPPALSARDRGMPDRGAGMGKRSPPAVSSPVTAPTSCSWPGWSEHAPSGIKPRGPDPGGSMTVIMQSTEARGREQNGDGRDDDAAAGDLHPSRLRGAQRMMLRRTLRIGFVLAVCLSITSPAYAYLDPGTGACSFRP